VTISKTNVIIIISYSQYCIDRPYSGLVTIELPTNQVARDINRTFYHLYYISEGTIRDTAILTPKPSTTAIRVSYNIGVSRHMLVINNKDG